MTFSVAGFCEKTGMVGVAISSSSICVASRCPWVRAGVGAASTQNIQLVDGGTYGATQGPRLETAAEIKRLKQDGCDMVGMTGMPEACLARELDMDYATCAVMANWAAGLSDSVITMADIEQTVDNSMVQIKQVLSELIRLQ